MNKKLYIFIFCYVLYFLKLNALVVGSFTTPSREGLTVFPTADSDNEMRGFAWFEEGFQMANSSTTCTYNSYFPVAGTFNLGGGRLYLNRNMFVSVTEPVVWGEVFGNNHFLELASTLTNFDSTTIGQAGGIAQVASITLAAVVNSVDWRTGDAYLSAATNDDNAEIKALSFDGATLTTVDTSDHKKNDSNCVRWNPATSFLAVVQAVKSGPNTEEVRIYSFDTGTETLTQVSVGTRGNSTTAVDWRPQGDYIAVGATNDVDVYPVDGSGNLGTIVNANTDPTGAVSHCALEWDDSGNYFAVGTAASAGTELLVYYFNGTTLTLTVSAEIGAAVNGLSWNPTGTFIAVGINGGSETIRVYEHHVWDGTLIENIAARVGETVEILSVDWNSDGTELAVGRIAGAGADTFIYSFDKDAVTLSSELSLDLGTGVNDIRWSRDDAYISVALTNNQVRVYSIAVGSQETINSALFDNVHLILDEELEVGITMTFQGNCIIEGTGHRLDISRGAIAASGELKFRNLELFGINNNNLRCITESDVIEFVDCRLELSDNYSFTIGSLVFEYEIDITGSTVFIYESTQGSTLEHFTTVLFDRGMSFSYAPAGPYKNLIEMEDVTAQLHFKEATLFVTSTGLELTKGTLLIEDNMDVFSDATVETEGVSLGDGTREHNLHVRFLADAKLNLESGFLTFDNPGDAEDEH